MVAQTGMNGNGSHAPPRGIFGHISELASDAVTLGELQVQLFVEDGKEGFARILIPILVLAAGALVLLFCVPLAMAVTVVTLAEVGEFTWLHATLLAFGIWLAAGGVIAVIGIAWLRSRWQLFERSMTELQANAEWFKSMIGRFSGKPNVARQPLP